LVRAQLARGTPLGRVTLERVLGDPARRIELG
jgi:hypothetical protein